MSKPTPIPILQSMLRMPAVELATGYGRASIYRLQKIGAFPRGIKIGGGKGGAIAWRASDIEAWIETRMSGREWKDSTAPDSATSHPVSGQTDKEAA